MDEYMDEFLNDDGFAPVMDSQPVTTNVIEHYKGKLPDRLLGYWEEYGFCGYGEGRYWTVNPSDYAEIMEAWLKQTPLWGRENFYVIARTAYGELYVWGDKCYDTVIIDPHYNTVLPIDLPDEPLTLEQRETYFGISFSTTMIKRVIFMMKMKNCFLNVA